MSMRPTRLILIAAAAAALALPLAMVRDVSANTAPNLSCGAPGTNPCSQTAHFTEVNGVGTPTPPSAGCPSWLSVDFVLIVGSGSGVEHVTVNKAGDFWFTSTFTGRVMITAYAPDQVDMTDPQNPVLIAGATPDAGVPVYSGKLTQWFGASGNLKNAVFNDTINVSAAAADGSTITVHDNSQQYYAPGSNLNGPPTRVFNHFTCR